MVYPLKDEGIKTLAPAFKTNTSLTSLTLWDTELTAVGVETLSEALKWNCSLAFINLGYNPLKMMTATALTPLLGSHARLRSIDMSHSALTNEGVKVLASVFKSNDSLISLNLKKNAFTDEGVTALAQALEVNSCLTSLNLEQNDFTCAGIEALAEALANNSSLIELSLTINADIPMPLVSRVTDLTLRNIEHFEKTHSTILCLFYRECIKDYFYQHLDEVSRAKVYRKISAAFGLRAKDVQFGEANVFRIWSKFETALLAVEIGADFHSKVMERFLT